MKKPTIFLSHSSSDKEVLLKLKEAFVNKTGGAIDIFQSSDGQSIPLGRNWVHRIQEALDEATIMIVFITPNSLRSGWIYFEAGYAYSKGIRVVPVGFLGTDLVNVAPPLGLLQGFNIVNKDGLDNLISLVNDTYSHSHKTSFTDEEYRSLIANSANLVNHPLADFAHFVEEIHIGVTDRDGLNCGLIEAISIAKEILTKNDVKYRGDEKNIDVFGLTIDTIEAPKTLNFTLDPSLIESTMPLAIQIIQHIRTEEIVGIEIRFDFVKQIRCISEAHKATARLIGTGISLGDGKSLQFDEMNFRTGQLMGFGGRGGIGYGATYLSIYPENNRFELKRVASLIKILFAKKVLYEFEEWITV